MGVVGLVCGGWYNFSDPSEQHLLPNRTEQIEISDSGLQLACFGDMLNVANTRANISVFHLYSY
jgi:hypothetical protein